MSALCAGCTVLLIDVPRSHLWIILTDPTPHPGYVLAVMVVTQRPHSDTTVVLRAGDHPFIKHDSCVSYSTAKAMSVTLLESWLKAGDAQMKAPLSPSILDSVRKGLVASDFTVNALRDYYRAEFE